MPGDWYEMRRGGEVLCCGASQNLGYPVHWLKDMARHGIYLYKNGKRVPINKIT